MRRLLRGGAQPNAVNQLGCGALHYAAAMGYTAAVAALLAGGADPCLQDHNRQTPLHLAAGLGQAAVVRRLLEASHACIDVPGLEHNTPLFCAVNESQLEAAQALLDAGAAVDAPNHHGRTPLIAAAMHGCAPLVRRLLAAGADVEAREGHGTGDTPLLIAVEYGRTECAGILLQVRRMR